MGNWNVCPGTIDRDAGVVACSFVDLEWGPLVWVRHYRSDDCERDGPLGPGLRHDCDWELELEDGVWSGVACWAGRAERWVRFTVPIAYDLRYDIVAKPSWAAPQPPRGQPPWGILIVGVVVGIAGNSTTTCQ